MKVERRPFNAVLRRLEEKEIIKVFFVDGKPNKRGIVTKSLRCIKLLNQDLGDSKLGEEGFLSN